MEINKNSLTEKTTSAQISIKIYFFGAYWYIWHLFSSSSSFSSSFFMHVYHIMIIMQENKTKQKRLDVRFSF